MTLPPGITLSVEDKPAEADIEVLPDGLEAFNDVQWPGHQPWQPLGVFLREQGAVVAGLAGGTYAGWLAIRYLWIAEPLRRLRLGSRLLGEAEQWGVAHGSHSAMVDTFSFQAPEFYRKQGYAEYARLDYPPRGERIFFRKRLSPAA